MTETQLLKLFFANFELKTPLTIKQHIGEKTSEANDMPSTKRLNQLTSNDRLTEMNEFLHFQFFPAFALRFE